MNSDSDAESLVKSKTTPSCLEVSITTNVCEYNTLYLIIILSLLASSLSKVSTGKTCNDSAVVMVSEEEEDEVKEKEGVFKKVSSNLVFSSENSYNNYLNNRFVSDHVTYHMINHAICFCKHY